MWTHYQGHSDLGVNFGVQVWGVGQVVPYDCPLPRALIEDHGLGKLRVVGKVVWWLSSELWVSLSGNAAPNCIGRVHRKHMCAPVQTFNLPAPNPPHSFQVQAQVCINNLFKGE